MELVTRLMLVTDDVKEMIAHFKTNTSHLPQKKPSTPKKDEIASGRRPEASNATQM
jgi:hypothetical protein